MIEEPKGPNIDRPSPKAWLEVAGPALAILVSAIEFVKLFDRPTPLEPWRVVLVLLPLLGVSAWLVVLIVIGRKPIAFNCSTLLFVLCYVVLFALAASSRLLDWRGSLIGYEDVVPVNWLALNRIGDWHYWFARHVHPPPQVMVVTIPQRTNKTLEEARLELASLIALARRAGASGIAFDFFLGNVSSAALDALLCEQIDQAWAQQPRMPVFVGYRHRVANGRAVPVLPAASLKACLSDERLGHLAVYIEWDGRVRMVPLDLGGNRRLPSLDLRIGEQICPDESRRAENRLLQFVEPEGLQSSIVPVAELFRDPSQAKSQFLLIGRESSLDRFDTPFGQRLGVVLHGNVVQALCNGQSIRHLEWWWELPLIGLSCFCVAIFAVRGASVNRLIVVTTSFTLVIVSIACVAMRWLIWIDSSYPVIALWLLLILLLIGRAGASLTVFQSFRLRR